MTNPFTPFTHPETSATTQLPLELLGRVADALPQALGLVDGASLDDRRAANGVLSQVPPEAMKVALQVAAGLPSVLWNPAPVTAYLAERERLAPAADVLHRLVLVETLLRRHLTVTGVPAAEAVLDLYLSLKRRAARRSELHVQDGASRLAECLPHAGPRPVTPEKKQPDPTPAK